MAKHFWLSWQQQTEDHRPLTCPPNAAILGWWCTGYDGRGNATLCALVQAKSEKDAENQVYVDWPEAGPWRFNDEVTGDLSLGDRYVIDQDWMRERLAAARTPGQGVGDGSS